MWTKERIASTIDHAILKPLQTDDDVLKECQIAEKWKVASVCVKPQHVGLARSFFFTLPFPFYWKREVKIGTVINFPYGMDTTEVQQAQAKQAIKDGVDELDIVMNLADFKIGKYKDVKYSLKQTIDYAKSFKNDIITKVIFEICYWNKEQIIKACEIAKEAKADFVKTSTGFGEFGASASACKIMIDEVGDTMGVKASGGIKNLSDLLFYLTLGCTRIGTSSTGAILKELEEGKK